MVYCLTYACTLPTWEITPQDEATKASEILKRSCKYFDLPQEQLTGTSRRRHLCEPRQMIMKALKSRTRLSLSEIGRMFSHRDHTTVIHSVRLVDSFCEIDAKYRKSYNDYINFILRA